MSEKYGVDFDPKKHYAKLDNIAENWGKILEENQKIMDKIRASILQDDSE